jgi:hypothetical protein
MQSGTVELDKIFNLLTVDHPPTASESESEPEVEAFQVLGAALHVERRRVLTSWLNFKHKHGRTL